MNDFQTRTHGKWILAGEHAVLRGSLALAFPLLSRHFDLRHRRTAGKLVVRVEGVQDEELRASILRVLERAAELINMSRSVLHGALLVINRIPCGAGLGASAALCVAVARWFESLGFLKSDALYGFARELENLFHGESSGLDIAVVLNARPVLFAKDSPPSFFEPAWVPQLYVSDTGARAQTKACVNRVKAAFAADPAQGERVDSDMRAAVQTCAQALRERSQSAVRDLAEGINLAASCFRRWGLIDRHLEDHIDSLHRAGACAAKPTGAGGGGYVLSLWKDPPQAAIRGTLIPCF